MVPSEHLSMQGRDLPVIKCLGREEGYGLETGCVDYDNGRFNDCSLRTTSKAASDRSVFPSKGSLGLNNMIVYVQSCLAMRVRR